MMSKFELLFTRMAVCPNIEYSSAPGLQVSRETLISQVSLCANVFVQHNITSRNETACLREVISSAVVWSFSRDFYVVCVAFFHARIRYFDKLRIFLQCYK